MHLLRTARILLAAALGLLAASACSSVSIPFVGGGDDDTGAAAGPTTDERRTALASRAVLRQGGEITKIKYYHLDTYRRVSAADPAITFEQRHYLHGAVSLEERLARFGHYYTVFWKADDRSAPVTVTIEYRQTNTGPQSFTKTVRVDRVRRSNTTDLQVTGEEYWENGPVTAYRITLTQNGETIAADQSFLWE